jgi:hypothetical protein
MTETNERATLYRKIAAVAGAIGRIEKDGYNPQLKYKYATPATVMEAVKPLLAEHSLAIVPTVTSVIKEPTGSVTQSGAAKVITRVEMTYLILDGESGESLAVPWCGEGEDWSDKGIAKAQTIALRTFLINFLQIPSGDEEIDPDARQQSAPIKGANYEPRQPVKSQAPASKPERTPAELADAIRELWSREKALDTHSTPADELATDLETAPVARLKELGRNAQARLAALRKAEGRPA